MEKNYILKLSLLLTVWVVLLSIVFETLQTILLENSTICIWLLPVIFTWLVFLAGMNFDIPVLCLYIFPGTSYFLVKLGHSIGNSTSESIVAAKLSCSVLLFICIAIRICRTVFDLDKNILPVANAQSSVPQDATSKSKNHKFVEPIFFAGFLVVSGYCFSQYSYPAVPGWRFGIISRRFLIYQAVIFCAVIAICIIMKLRNWKRSEKIQTGIWITICSIALLFDGIIHFEKLSVVNYFFALSTLFIVLVWHSKNHYIISHFYRNGYPAEIKVRRKDFDHCEDYGFTEDFQFWMDLNGKIITEDFSDSVNFFVERQDAVAGIDPIFVWKETILKD